MVQPRPILHSNQPISVLAGPPGPPREPSREPRGSGALPVLLLEVAQLLHAAARQDTLLQLWRERVGLLDALVDVHLTLANDVGL